MSSPSVLMFSLLIKKRAEICEVFLFDVRFGGMSVWEVCRHNRSPSKTPATHTQYLTLISDKRNHSQIKQKRIFHDYNSLALVNTEKKQFNPHRSCSRRSTD